MKFIYCDAALTNDYGHFATHCRFITRAVRLRGIDTHILANRAIDSSLAAALGARPHFSVDPRALPSNDPICGWMLSFDANYRALLADLSTIESVDRDDIVYSEHTRAAELMALAHWVQQRFTPETCPMIVVAVGEHTGATVLRAPDGQAQLQLTFLPTMLYRYASRHVSAPYAGRFHFLAYDTKTAELYRELLDQPVGVVPQPNDAVTAARNRAGTTLPTISFLGAQGPFKGMQILPAAVTSLLQKHASIRVLVHDSYGGMTEQVQALKQIAAGDSRFEFRLGPVTSEEWAHLLDRSDVLVLPYRQDVYANAASGIVAEGIVNAIPMAVPRGTAMERQLVEFGMPGVIFEKSDSESVLPAIATLLGGFDKFANRAHAASRAWQAKSGAGGFLDAIIAQCGDATHAWRHVRSDSVRSDFNVVVDGVFFQLYRTGISRVWRSLLEEWAKTPFGRRIVVADRAGTAPRVPGIRYVEVPAYSYGLLEQDRRMLQDLCDRERASVMVSSYYTTPLTTASVFMGYDMMPELMGQNLETPVWAEKRRAIEHASAYITISQNTARDLACLYPYTAKRGITVAPCGVAREFSPADDSQIADFCSAQGISKPYFMLSGARGGYKNTALFFRALERLPDRERFEVVCTGVIPELEPEYTALLGPVRAQVLDLPDETLRLAYAGALALVYPSLYEGFGIPVIEAMACGCPVITTRRGSLPEVAGEAALYVDPDNIDGLVQALTRVQEPGIRAQLVQAGLERARGFSWEQMARITSVTLEAAAVRAMTAAGATPPAAGAMPEHFDVNSALQLATRSLQEQRPQEAAGICQQILRAQPAHPSALHLLGLSLFQLGDAQSAVEHIERALQARPDFAVALNSLGVILSNLGRNDAALACFDRALAVNPEFSIARECRAHFIKR